MSVYALHDPRTGVCRYVGHSRRAPRRFRQHIGRPHSAGLRGWIAELRAGGLTPEFRLLDGATEREWIARLSPDLNVARGVDEVERDFGPDIELKVRVSAEQKRQIEAAAGACKPFPLSLGKWVLLAVLEKLERDGFAVKEKGKRG